MNYPLTNSQVLLLNKWLSVVLWTIYNLYPLNPALFQFQPSWQHLTLLTSVFLNALFLWSPCHHILLIFFLSSLACSSISFVGISSFQLLNIDVSQGFSQLCALFTLCIHLKLSDSFLLLMTHKSIIPNSIFVLRHTCVCPNAYLTFFLGSPSGTSNIAYPKVN